ncbi:MAG: hypothetical protein RJA70_4812, partial [Pseudomonadota bacterium]
DGKVDPTFELCDTGLSAVTPLCLQTEITAGTKTLSDCGCTAEVLTPGGLEECRPSVCGNGVIQKDAGEECDPPQPGACSTSCKLEIEPCTACMLEFDFRDTEGLSTCPGAAGFLSDTKTLGGVDTAGLGCLGDPACFKLWSCAVETNCLNESGTGFFGCYCGDGVSIGDCSAPSFVPTGSCKDEVLEAREAQQGFPFKENAELISEISLDPTPRDGRYPSANIARTLIEGCLDSAVLQSDLEAAKAADRLGPYTVDQCLAACIKP